MLDGIDTERNRIGDTFQASLDEDLQADGVVVRSEERRVGKECRL